MSLIEICLYLTSYAVRSAITATAGLNLVIFSFRIVTL